VLHLTPEGVRNGKFQHVGEICALHGLQQRSDDYGSYWVHPEFEDVLMIDIDDNGNWEDGTPEQQGNVEEELELSFDNALEADLGRYLSTLIGILRQGRSGRE
jgi:hypothetical protein